MTIQDLDAEFWMMVAAIAASLAALFAYHSTRVTKRLAEVDLYLRFRERYASEEIRTAMNAVYEWHVTHGSDSVTRYVTLQDEDPELWSRL